jgi:predicted Rossmann fold flavoprotein
MKFFEERGVSLKTERGNRVFPVSDKASTILEAMKRSLGKTEIIYESAISVKEGFLVETENYIIESESVIIASGGASYHRTGSSGDGYNFAEKLGHTIVPIKPALIPIVTREKDAAEMQGLSLKNVVLSLYKKDKKKPIYSEMGEMLFTHFGLSGPLVLTASCYIKDNPEDYKVEIDLKPALSREALHKRILRDFEENKNKALSNVLPLLLPRAMIPVIIKRIGVDPLKKINGITGAEREALVENMKAFSFEVSSLRPIEEAIITSGGIKTNEIDPKTMESKICRGLFFAGEVIDVNALTGGFNLQIAFSTGYTAGMNA